MRYLNLCFVCAPKRGFSVADQDIRDPNNGTLQYRQYMIADLIAGNYGFEDCTILLARGTLPTEEEKSNLRKELFSGMRIPSSVLDVVRSFP